jgi:hypothetical protein
MRKIKMVIFMVSFEMNLRDATVDKDEDKDNVNIEYNYDECSSEVELDD